MGANNMGRTVVYGTPGSTYTRSVRLVLEEKHAEYEFVDVPPFAAYQQFPHLSRQPFGRVPAFEHDDFALYETQAILRYVDQVFPGERFQPEDARQCARMNQIIGIVDAYAWTSIAGGILYQRFVLPRFLGQSTDQAVIGAALPRARLCVEEFTRLMANGLFLVDDRLTLGICISISYEEITIVYDTSQTISFHSHSIVLSHGNALIFLRKFFLLTVEARATIRQNLSLLILKDNLAAHLTFSSEDYQ